MPFKHKLSRRLADSRGRALLLVGAAMLFACEPAGDLPSSPSKPAYDTASTGVGFVSDLRVGGATDTSVTLTFTEVSDGTGRPASYEIRSAAGSISWGAATDVSRGSCATPVVGTAIGASRSCTVFGLKASTAYQFQLVAFRGTLNVNAAFGDLSNVATGSTTAPFSGSATLLLQESFEDANFSARAWYDNTAIAVTSAQHISGSAQAMEAHFTVGATTPTWGGAARHLLTPTTSVYLSYWVKYSSNWVGSGKPYHPHEFLFMTTEDGAYTGPSFTHLTTYVEHNYQNGGIPVLDLQDGSNIDQSHIGVDLTNSTENRAANGCNGNTDGYSTGCYVGNGSSYVNEKKFFAAAPSFMPNPGPGYKGDWHFVEVYYQLNSIQNGKGVADGVARYWFDGQLVIDHSNVLMRTGAHASMKFNQLLVAPYIGDGSPVDQTMWVDNLTVATGRVSSATPPPAAVASVAVSPAAASQSVGGTQQLTVTLKDAGGNVLTGRTVTWASSNAAVATVTGNGLEAGLTPGTVAIAATSGGVSGSAAITVNATSPGTVSDLGVTGKTDTSVTVSFTEVNDGTGKPASYDLRFAPGTLSWGSASNPSRGTCTNPVIGMTIGAKRTCSVLGLTASTAYQVELVAFRGTLNVSAVFGALSNVASGSTNAPAVVSVATVTVTPSSVSGSIGQTAQFTATLKDASGNVLTGRTVTWTSSAVSVATITGNGLVSALLAGTSTITATSEGKSGTASLTVTALPPPPPAGWPHEPSGLSVWSDYGFGTAIPVTSSDVPLGDGSGWSSIYNGNGLGSIGNDPAAPASPPAVFQLKYPVGFTGGASPSTLYYNLPNVNQVYAGFWWKPSNPWQGHASNVNKIAFLFPGNNGDMYLAMYGPPGGPYQLRVLPEFPGLPVAWYVPNVTQVAVALGQWHRIEWWVDRTAGVVRWWMDGQLIGDYSGVAFPSGGFTNFEFSSTWGGIGDSKTETDYYWFDHVHLSGH